MPDALPGTVKGARSYADLAPYIGQVMQKLETGHYPTVPVPCFCGSEGDDLPLTRHDRYLIPHRMVLCRQCSLMRATPRMTQDAYTEFYNTEYRPIYDGWEFGPQAGNTDMRFMKQAEDGVSFKAFLGYFNIKPKSILDLGCNMGGLLLPFKEDGVEVYGADLCHEAVTYGRELGIPMIEGGMDEVIARGIRADLVVLQDVVEHLLDLRELSKLHQILNPGGIVYIGTPGLFSRPIKKIWQNAHVWQFVAETLNYVMSEQGFDSLFLDENIDSLWTPIGADAVRLAVKKPAFYQPYILEHLQGLEKRKLPPVRCLSKFTVEERLTNIDGTLSLKFPSVGEVIQKYKGPVAIVGGGPSVEKEMDRLKALKASGVPVMVIDRMYPWAVREGLGPDFVAILDGSDDVKDGLTHVQPDTVHLIGSSIDPVAAKMLLGTRTYVYNGHNPYMKIQDLWYKHGYEEVTMVNTGGSVTLGAMTLALMLGFRNLHVFGFDCMVSDDAAQTYAGGIAGQSVPRNYFPVDIKGKTYLTCLAFLSFAQQYVRMIEDARKSGLVESVDMYGRSLVNALLFGEADYDATKDLELVEVPAHG